ncbi:hypothetical protein Dimus_026308 [Dionaea muscipula]
MISSPPSLSLSAFPSTMDTYSSSSHPGDQSAGDSSPPSRDVDLDNPPPTTDQEHLHKVKFMVSYGGRIHPRPHDNQLSYVGGETKILALDRGFRFPGLLSKVCSLCDAHVLVKYQLPGEDLDALISVTNDDDLEHMMHEHDRLHRAAASRPARLRLFLFPLVTDPVQQPGFESGGRCGAKSDTDRFLEALNCGGSAAQSPPEPNNMDFLFGLDKGIADGAPPPPPTAIKPQDPDPDTVSGSSPRQVPDPQIDARIQELNRLQVTIADHPPKREDNSVGDCYAQNPPENLPPPMITVNSLAPVTNPAAYYWPQEKSIASGGYQPVYMIPAPMAHYHAQIVRPVNGHVGKGYYQIQRIVPEIYREQPGYSMVPPPFSAVGWESAGNLPSQQSKVTPDGMGSVTGGAGGLSEGVYAQVGYDSVTGRQLYFTAASSGGMGTASQYQAVAGTVMAANGDAKPVGFTAASSGGVTPPPPQYQAVGAAAVAVNASVDQ